MEPLVKNLDPLLNVNADTLKNLRDRLFNRFRGVVQTGPLAGMRIDNHFEWDDQCGICPKLIGNYEFELHDAVRKAMARKPDTVINAGCAEGYYAVGLGRLSGAKVYAIDINGKCLDQCGKNAMLNGILDLVLVDGKPGAKDLIRGEGHRLFFVDVEGYELSLLDPLQCPDLLSGDIIVECHDFLVDGDPNNSFVSDTLRRAFSATHDIEVISPRIPQLSDYPFLRDLPIGLQLLAIMENRPLPTVWLACWTKQGEKNG